MFFPTLNKEKALGGFKPGKSFAFFRLYIKYYKKVPNSTLKILGTYLVKTIIFTRCISMLLESITVIGSFVFS